MLVELPRTAPRALYVALPPGIPATQLDVMAQILLDGVRLDVMADDALATHLAGISAEEELALVEQASRLLGRAELRARLVIADTMAAAILLARLGTRSQRVAPGQTGDAVGALPLGGLGLPEADVALLAGWGVRTVGAFVALPVAAVSVRFGPRVAELHAVLHGLVKGPEHIQADLLDWYEAAPLGTVPEGAAAPAAALPSKPSNVIRVDFTRREVVRA